MDTGERVRLLGADPVPWVLASDEPGAIWLTLTGVLGLPGNDPEVAAARSAALSDPGVQNLVARLGDWEVATPLSGHESPAFAPNLLSLLADHGVASGDFAGVDAMLDAMPGHSDDDGRFQSIAEWKRIPEPVWSVLPCDSHAILETLARFRGASDPRVRRAFVALGADVAQTAQGSAWLCRPDPVTCFRGPGRKGDACPMVTLQALRAASYLPAADQPRWVGDAARVSLRAWRERGVEKPYMFGHGRQFKRGKWPATWYSALAAVDAIGRFPEVWSGAGAAPEDRRALAELAACLIAYNVDRDTGTITPRSCYKGFEEHSFGQKKRPSPFATAKVLAALERVAVIADDIAAVDVTVLGSSKGGSGVALPP